MRRILIFLFHCQNLIEMKTNRFITSILFAAIAMMAFAVSPGVSKDLATWRKAAYSDVTYTLHFDVPAQRTAPVNGTVDISFGIAKGMDAVIDFRADRSAIASVAVNNKNISDYTFADEHIVIPAKRLKSSRNTVSISFTAGAKPLNRNDEFVYTLLVPDRARTLFPCFDQPDIKATYNLTLDVPADWIAISNTSVQSETVSGNTRHVVFAPTEPLSTYLFSFVAGKFTRDTRSRDGRTISAYHRENDPSKIAQLDTIFSQVFNALTWQENFTDIKYPFAKYDFVILPGFQFGGMEHTGATLYNDRMMFLGNHPTPGEELARAQLIAHETSHMWFGDLVTMAWFDDVWTKEVFANYFAAVITEPTFPGINHTLNRITSFYAPSLAEDRTDGTTAIQQPLDNLQDAGLIYGKIIYDKAPVVMFKIVEMMGMDAYQRGIRDYVKKYAYSNATWDDLIACLDAQTPADLKQFSEVWIKAKGMPIVSFVPTENGFTVSQSDIYGRGLLWPQRFNIKAIGADTVATVNVDLSAPRQHYDVGFAVQALVPNADGVGYGYFAPDANSLSYIQQHWSEIADDVERMSAVMVLYENYLHYRITDTEAFANSLLSGVANEQNPLIASAVIDAIDFVCTHTEGELRRSIELSMRNLAANMSLQSARLLMQRKLLYSMTQPEVINDMHNAFFTQSAELWSESDYTNAAYELSVRIPSEADSILTTQRARITNADRLKQFDFVSRACTADTARLDSLFESLRDPANRLVEPYAQTLLYYLNHPSRDEYSARYIEPGLEMLAEIQRTGDIFFPSQWTRMLLSSHRSPAARAALIRFLAERPDYPQLLRNKILQSAYPLTW